MSESIIKDTLNRMQEAYDRGYAEGFRRGAESEKNAGIWNLPEVKPKHEEIIVAIARPYNRKTRSYCKKHGLSYCRVEGMFLDGNTIKSFFTEEKLGGCDDDFPDAILITKHKAVAFENVVLWISNELPEGFPLTEGKNG